MSKRIVISMLALVFGLMFLSGCASTQPAKLYVLHSPAMGKNMKPDESLKNVSIALSRIRLPKHMDRPAIITQVTASELHYSEFQRWAGPLDDDLGRVITLNLSKLIGSSKVAGDRVISSGKADYTLDIEILGMTGILGKEAKLAARWRITKGKDDEPAQVSISRYKVELQSSDYGVYVAAQSKMISDLSKDIAEAVHQLSKK